MIFRNTEIYQVIVYTGRHFVSSTPPQFLSNQFKNFVLILQTYGRRKCSLFSFFKEENDKVMPVSNFYSLQALENTRLQVYLIDFVNGFCLTNQSETLYRRYRHINDVHVSPQKRKKKKITIIINK